MKKAWNCAESPAKWIFPEREKDCINQYVDFFHEFSSTGKSAELRISADTDFVVWLNGQLVGHGQYSDYPDAKTFESFTLNDLKKDGNQLAITVFYNGRNSSVYRRGEPGLIYEISDSKLLCASGAETLWRDNPCYHSGPIAIVSGQLAYTFGYDARGNDNFTDGNYKPGKAWQAMANTCCSMPNDRALLNPRPIQQLVTSGPTASKVLNCGIFQRDKSLIDLDFESPVKKENPLTGFILENDQIVSPAWLMQHDYLSDNPCKRFFACPRGHEIKSQEDGLKPQVKVSEQADGVYLTIDMEQQEVGLLSLDIDAEEGTVLDIAYGEHLDDGRVRSLVGGRNFAGRYICRDGRQSFFHPFLRWAGRYLQIHIHNKDFALYELQLLRREYPLEQRGAFDNNNPLQSRIIDVSRRTLFSCMHEHYEDTPWREQALYANDARIQALCGYYAFGEYDFPKSSFALLGHGLREDGFLELTAPALPRLTIPSFTLVWMLAVRDHYLYSGDPSLAKEFLPQITSMLKRFLDEREDALLPLRQAQGVWHFYDWVQEMSGYGDKQFDDGLRYDAPLNCFLILALEAWTEMKTWLGEQDANDFQSDIASLRQAVLEHFWDKKEELIKTHAFARTDNQLSQALAVIAGIGDDAIRSKLLEQLAENKNLVQASLSQSFYTFQAAMTKKDKYGEKIIEKIRETWSIMLNAGATTFWETINGASDFSDAGSLCHAWSAGPLYFYFHDLAGVQPLEPGFKRFKLEPIAGCLNRGQAQIPVPNGKISLKWEGSDVHVEAPENCQIQ